MSRTMQGLVRNTFYGIVFFINMAYHSREDGGVVSSIRPQASNGFRWMPRNIVMNPCNPLFDWRTHVGSSSSSVVCVTILTYMV